MAFIHLNKNNFFYNLDIIADKTKSKDKIALVLKDNAYSHGLCEMAQMAQEYGITKAVVRTDEEAYKIYDYFEYILVLGDMPQKADEKIHYTINSFEAIKLFPQGSKVELKVNSGMNRNGIQAEELEKAFLAISEAKLNLQGLFTHHACADEEGEYFDFQQVNFMKIKTESKVLAEKYGFTIQFHSANSAALFRSEEFTEDMTRVGIAAYGCLEMPSSLPQTQLKPVLSVYAKKLSSRLLQEGDCVGYGASFQSKKEQVVTNYDFGYGDGFLRACSNSYKTPQDVSIAGRISMDNASFLSADDELLIFDDAREAAKHAGTISYEVLTSLKPHLPREIVE